MNRSELLEKIEICRPAISRKYIIPILGHFCFDENCCFGYDDQVCVETDIDAPFVGAVKGEEFAGVLKSFSSEDISIKSNKASIEVKSGKSKVKLPTKPKEEFIWEGVDKSYFSYSCPLTDDFAKGLKCALLSVSQSSYIRHSMAGVTLDINKKSFNMYSTDNESITAYYGQLKEDAPKARALLTEKFCRLAILYFTKYADEEAPTLHLADDLVLLEFPALCRLYSKIPSTELLDYEKQINSIDTENLYPIPEGFEQALQRGVVLSDSPVKFTISNGSTLTLRTEGVKSESEDQFDLEGSHEDFEAHVSPNLILRLIKDCERMAHSENCLVFRGPNFLHLVANR